MKTLTSLFCSLLLFSLLTNCKNETKSTDSKTEINATVVDPISELKKQEEAVTTNPIKEAYFGELHMHTALSLDALFGQIGDGPVMPDDSYRFAKGEDVNISGRKHNIVRPLDFAAVTDHAEYIGESYSAITPGAPGYDSPDLKDLRSADTFEKQMAWYGKFSKNQRGADGPTLRRPCNHSRSLENSSKSSCRPLRTRKVYYPNGF